MPYNDFTEMPVWQQAMSVVEEVYKVSATLPKNEEYALSSQLKRAALSMTANTAEAFGRSHSKDKVNFYLYARGSAFEVRNHLIVGKKLNFFTDQQIESMNTSCMEIVQSLNKIIKGLCS